MLNNGLVLYIQNHWLMLSNSFLFFGTMFDLIFDLIANGMVSVPIVWYWFILVTGDYYRRDG